MNRGQIGKKWRTNDSKRLCETMDSSSVVNASSVFNQDLEKFCHVIYYKNPQGSKYMNLQHFSFPSHSLSLSPSLSLALFSFHHSLIGRRLSSSTLLRTRGTDIRIRITRHDQTRINRFGHVRELET